MSATELAARLAKEVHEGEHIGGSDAMRIREEIHREFEIAATEKDRVILLGLHKVNMDAMDG